MRDARRKSNESGVAMLLAIFTLLLLTAVGLSLLCAADLETNIAANYRDKQVANYAALSGLQEARDRLIPSRCLSGCDAIGIDTSTLQPPSTSGGVIYIINPANGETVAPWDPNNKYTDTELCKEKIPSFCTGTNHDVLPIGSWYTVIDDSNATQGGWYHPVSGTALPSAMGFKWVRITLKTDNMTPAPAESPTNDSIMCWDGKYQVPIPSGYSTTCMTSHGLALSYNGSLCPGNVCNFNPPNALTPAPIGSGYTGDANGHVALTFNGGGGSGAAGYATVTPSGGGQVTAITVGNAGSGYTQSTPPQVQITSVDGNGSGATASATVSSAGAPVTALSGVTQQNPVGCYAVTPSVTITPVDSAGNGATATANMTGNTCVVSWTPSYSSGNCSGTFTVGVSDGGGSNFEGTITVTTDPKNGHANGIASSAITNPGNGYTSAPTTLSGVPGSCKFTNSFTLGKQVQSLTLGPPTPSGAGYDQPPTVTIAAPNAPAGEAPPTATATIGSVLNGYISGVTITNAGSGYTQPPQIQFNPVDGNGSGANATATVNPITGGAISSITLTSSGGGYTSAPSVTIGGGGTGASVQTNISTPTQYGRIYLATAMAVSPGGSKSISQMELATPVILPFKAPGGLTIDAPPTINGGTLQLPGINVGNSSNYVIDGQDGNTGGNVPGCSYPSQPAKPSIAVTDNPYAPTSPTTVQCLTSMLGGAPSTDSSCSQLSGVKATNYYGAQTSPDVENVYGTLGDLTTPAGCDELATAITAKAVASSTYYNGNVTCTSTSSCGIQLNTYPNCPAIVVNGDLTFGKSGTTTGQPMGCGVLLVTGTLTMQGNYTWDGPVFVIGKTGEFVGSGGGNGQINGSLFVAQDKNSDGTLRSTLGTPTVSFDISGGGGNGIYYNSCYSDAMLDALNLEFLPSNAPLKILSVRNIF